MTLPIGSGFCLSSFCRYFERISILCWLFGIEWRDPNRRCKFFVNIPSKENQSLRSALFFSVPQTSVRLGNVGSGKNTYVDTYNVNNATTSQSIRKNGQFRSNSKAYKSCGNGCAQNYKKKMMETIRSLLFFSLLLLLLLVVSIVQRSLSKGMSSLSNAFVL